MLKNCLKTIWLLIGLLLACNPLAVEPDQTEVNAPVEVEIEAELPVESQGKEDMVSMLFPKLYLSINGQTALLDKMNGEIEVYRLPDLTRQYLEQVESLDELIVSSSGSVVAWRTSGHTLTVTTPAGRQIYQLPQDRGHLMSTAISDAGDRVALLIFTELQHPGDNIFANGAIEIWSLPPAGQPLASRPVPVFDYGFVAADGSFSTFSVRSARRSGAHQFGDIFRYETGSNGLTSLDSQQIYTTAWLDTALYHGWAWGVQNDSLIGWNPTGQPIQLPGKVGDHLRFSPDGEHLLAYRVEKLAGDSGVDMLFRLFDLVPLAEVKRVNHVIQNASESQFILDDQLALFEVRVTLDGQLAVKALEW